MSSRAAGEINANPSPQGMCVCVYTYLYTRARLPSPAALSPRVCRYATFNALNAWLPSRRTPLGALVRNAAIGLVASLISDTVSNSLRVLKTTKQTLAFERAGAARAGAAAGLSGVTYADALRAVLETDGARGLFTRGLSTRLCTNGAQSIIFAVVWRYLAQRWAIPSAASSK